MERLAEPGQEEALGPAAESFIRGYLDALSMKKIRVVDLCDTQTKLVDWEAGQLATEGNTFLDPGLYVLPEFKDSLNGPDGVLSKVEVTRSTTAETSAHQVFFVDLIDTERGRIMPVAVKPFVDKPCHVVDDFVGGVRAQQNCITTFQPIGYLVGGEASYSLTVRDGATESLDVRSWENTLMNLDDESFDYQRQKLKEVGGLVAGLHARGIFHGDLQFKNITQNVSGEVSFIDWESSQFIDPADDKHTTEDRAKAAASDLWAIYASATRSEGKNGVGLLTRFDRELRWKYFDHFILTNYIDEYTKLLGEGDESFASATDIEEIVKERARLWETIGGPTV